MPRREQSRPRESGIRFPADLPADLQEGRPWAFAFLGEDREACAGIIETQSGTFVVFLYSPEGGLERMPFVRRSPAYRAFNRFVEDDAG